MGCETSYEGAMLRKASGSTTGGKRRKENLEPSSVSGTLTVEQVIELMRIGREVKAKVLRFRDLYVRFVEEPQIAEAGHTAPESSTHPKARSEDELKRVGRAGRVAERDDLISDELEQLKITDPAAYEAFIQSEDVDDGDRGSQ